jgi:putative heme-binding domain-containing protein
MRVVERAVWVATWLMAATPAFSAPPPPAANEPLDRRLAAEPLDALAAAAQSEGDADRGAVLFHRAYLSCAKCHVAADSGRPAGPDLARDRRGLSPADLIRSVLDPSHEVRKGYETVTVATTDGRTLTGLLVEDRPDALVLRDPTGDDRAV